jgi:hypothetical protein
MGRDGRWRSRLDKALADVGSLRESSSPSKSAVRHRSEAGMPCNTARGLRSATAGGLRVRNNCTLPGAGGTRKFASYAAARTWHRGRSACDVASNLRRNSLAMLFARCMTALLLSAVLGWHAAAGAVEVVRYPGPESPSDRRFAYSHEMLELALSKSGLDFRIEQASVPMNPERLALELEADRTIDVAAIPRTLDRESRLLHIPIPLTKGLIGWRVGLVRKGDEHLLAGVRSLNDLKGVRIGQAQDWPDTTILRASGLDVITAPRYDTLFQMLINRRFDYFPRGAIEIWAEQERHADTLVVEPHVVIHYVNDAFFMVNRKKTGLAQRIRDGLEKAIADGSFDRLFDKYYGERLRKARLDERTVIEMGNPLMPAGPLERPELWFGIAPQLIRPVRPQAGSSGPAWRTSAPR